MSQTGLCECTNFLVAGARELPLRPLLVLRFGPHERSSSPVSSPTEKRVDYEIRTVDVFSERPFEGNQLAGVLG